MSFERLLPNHPTRGFVNCIGSDIADNKTTIMHPSIPYQASAGQDNRHGFLRTFLQRLHGRPGSEYRQDRTAEQNTILEANSRFKANNATPPPAYSESTAVSNKQQQHEQAQAAQASDRGCSHCSHCNVSSHTNVVEAGPPESPPPADTSSWFCTPCQHARRSDGFDHVFF